MCEIEKNNNPKRVRINFYVSENEYEKIKENAKNSHNTITAYISNCAVNPYNLIISYDEIKQHTQEIAEVKQAVNHLINTLAQSGNYYPADIENLLNLLNQIDEGEKNLLKTFRKTQIKLCKDLKKIISENERKKEDV